MSGITDILLAESSIPPLQRTYTSSGTETIPANYTTVVLEVWGGTGSGGAGTGIDGSQGGGGASGSYARSSYTVTGQAGKTMVFSPSSAGSGLSSTVISGTFAITSINSPSGGNGASGTSIGPGIGGTAGGIATGGTASNQNGNDGKEGGTSGNQAGGGGIGIVGIYTTGANGSRGLWGVLTNPGQSGLVSFTYTP